MIQIKLRDYYPAYSCCDMIVDVTEEVAEQLRQWERSERACQRKRQRYRAQYSLDLGDSIEREVIFSITTPDEYYVRRMTCEQLHAALSALPNKQAKRIYAHFVMGVSQTAISHAEGVSRKAVSKSIASGLNRLKQMLEKKF